MDNFSDHSLNLGITFTNVFQLVNNNVVYVFLNKLRHYYGEGLEPI